MKSRRMTIKCILLFLIGLSISDRHSGGESDANVSLGLDYPGISATGSALPKVTQEGYRHENSPDIADMI